jgi:hypothetical protein
MADFHCWFRFDMEFHVLELFEFRFATRAVVEIINDLNQIVGRCGVRDIWGVIPVHALELDLSGDLVATIGLDGVPGQMNWFRSRGLCVGRRNILAFRPWDRRHKREGFVCWSNELNT